MLFRSGNGCVCASSQTEDHVHPNRGIRFSRERVWEIFRAYTHCLPASWLPGCASTCLRPSFPREISENDYARHGMHGDACKDIKNGRPFHPSNYADLHGTGSIVLVCDLPRRLMSMMTRWCQCKCVSVTVDPCEMRGWGTRARVRNGAQTANSLFAKTSPSPSPRPRKSNR